MRKLLASAFLLSSIATAQEESALRTVKRDDPDMIRIAVIDTGFDVDHPMVGALYSVKAQICDNGTSRFNFVNPPIGRIFTDDVKDEHGHGTHIAGLIAKYAGLAPFCLMPMKYYDPKGADILNLTRDIQSFRKAIELNADIINFSGGGIAKSDEECEVITGALDKGIIVVVAAGNERSDITKHKYWPAMCDKRVVAVAARDRFGNKLPSSNYSEEPRFGSNGATNGATVKLKIEDGDDVFSILPGGQYGYMTGTSQATAIMSGKLANHLFIMRKSEYGRYLVKKAPGWGK